MPEEATSHGKVVHGTEKQELDEEWVVIVPDKVKFIFKIFKFCDFLFKTKSFSPHPVMQSTGKKS